MIRVLPPLKMASVYGVSTIAIVCLMTGVTIYNWEEEAKAGQPLMVDEIEMCAFSSSVIIMSIFYIHSSSIKHNIKSNTQRAYVFRECLFQEE
ncbi:hypothetical protein Patl1_03939 [Pistacia atlantica]|uniref:Uncharacterized protein n=1 Tax=Pistacia atlantica TaxID=434234 RepID=A0ACC1BQN9_9ROSI|nr:hypothetical protein Patl1_03939 [Pistacia atlantica]